MKYPTCKGSVWLNASPAGIWKLSTYPQALLRVLLTLLFKYAVGYSTHQAVAIYAKTRIMFYTTTERRPRAQIPFDYFPKNPTFS
jgi:hypothetical protein